MENFGGEDVDCTLRLGPADNLVAKADPSPATKKMPTHFVQGSPSQGVNEITEKKCSDCNRTITPCWRSGPNGKGTLCNACGLAYKKQNK